MRAWKVKKHGLVDDSLVLEALDSSYAALQGEAFVKVRFISLNHLDLWVLKGVDGHTFPLPLIPGCDIIGEVSSLGSLTEAENTLLQKKNIKIGSKVLIQPILFCGECISCKKGYQAICKKFGLFGETQNGGAATFIRVPIRNLIKLNPTADEKKMVCLPIAYTTAYSMLFRKLKLEKNETILIQAAGSGVSVAAIQLAKKIGAYVVALVRGEERVQKILDLGADLVIQTDRQSSKEELKLILKKLDKKGFDCALDHLGGDSFKESLRFLDWGGRLAICGATLESKVTIDLKPIFFKNLSIYGNTMGSENDLLQLVEWVENGELSPVVDSEYSMTNLKEAYKKLQKGKVFGKLIVNNNL